MDEKGLVAIALNTIKYYRPTTCSYEYYVDEKGLVTIALTTARPHAVMNAICVDEKL